MIKWNPVKDTVLYYILLCNGGSNHINLLEIYTKSMSIMR